MYKKEKAMVTGDDKGKQARTLLDFNFVKRELSAKTNLFLL